MTNTEEIFTLDLQCPGYESRGHYYFVSTHPKVVEAIKVPLASSLCTRIYDGVLSLVVQYVAAS